MKENRDVSKVVGENIRYNRNQKGLSQEQLGFKAELNSSYIGEIERGIKSPTLKTLNKIVNALDITFEDIFTFDKNIEFKDTTIIDRIAFEFKGRSDEEQLAVYSLIREILKFKDTK